MRHGNAITNIFLVMGLFLYSNVLSENSNVDEMDYQLSLNDLLNIEVHVASLVRENFREAPGILTVISKEDIKSNNCRDLIDVFNMVPGFSIATDIFETGALVSRGLYGFEGRALIMVDGMQMNDNYFGTYVLGNDFPVALIQRIEIIRGPGSAIYGGAAELAVVNIITQPDYKKSIQGNIVGRYGILSNGEFGHREIGVALNRTFKDFKFHLAGSVNQSTKAVSSERQDILFVDSLFPHYNLDQNTAGSSNISLTWSAMACDRVNLKGVYQRYQNNFGNVLYNDDSLQWIGQSYRRGELFETLNAEVNAHVPIIKQLTLIPGINYHYDLAWYNNFPKGHNQSTAHPTYRIKPFVNTQIKMGAFSATCGGELFVDIATVKFDSIGSDSTKTANTPYAKPGDTTFYNSVSIWNTALFATAKYTFFDILSLNGGMRFDQNELTGFGFSPRGGLTLVLDKFHTKLLYSSAYRAPNVANSVDKTSSLNIPNETGEIIPIKKETTRILELEMGIMPIKGLMLLANGYAQVVSDIIEFNPEYDYYSKNGGEMGSMGFEASAELKKGIYSGVVNVSYVEPGIFGIENKSIVRKALDGKTYLTPDGKNHFLGVPSFKLYTNHNFQINKKLSVNTNVLFYSQRYQHRYYKDDVDSVMQVREISPQAICGMGVQLKDVVFKRTSVTVSVHDLFNQQMQYISTYDTYFFEAHPFSSVKYKGREVSLALSYGF